ncbi:DUF4265 domain-containing protein [Hymenobacter sp. B81]|uniref:DUF4265 domain-containing protein n=1 Tax=Hymenobacter sp. B81 TaxID=3344878 RepID=UPI0037DD624E
MNYPDNIPVVLTYKHDPEDEEIFTERVIAERVGDYYRVILIPAFAKNLAYGDLIAVEYDEGEFHFEDLIEESGYSVVHIVVFQTAASENIAEALARFGCGVNPHVSDNYIVVNIPPEVDYEPVQAFLLTEESSGTIDFRESCLSQLHAPGKS